MNRSYEAAALALANEELAEAMLEASSLGRQTRRQLQQSKKHLGVERAVRQTEP